MITITEVIVMATKMENGMTGTVVTVFCWDDCFLLEIAGTVSAVILITLNTKV